MSKINETVTDIAKELLLTITKVELSESLGISRPTLDTRLDRHNWKAGEIRLLKDLKDENSKG